MNLFYLIGVFYMDYDEKLFKAKANIKARRIWLVFALLLTANYGSDVSSGLYPVNNYIIFVILCWIPFFIGEILLRIKGKDTDIYKNLASDDFALINEDGSVSGIAKAEEVSGAAKYYANAYVVVEKNSDGTYGDVLAVIYDADSNRLDGAANINK